jgi:hypothetical protein
VLSSFALWPGRFVFSEARVTEEDRGVGTAPTLFPSALQTMEGGDCYSGLLLVYKGADSEDASLVLLELLTGDGGKGADREEAGG